MAERAIMVRGKLFPASRDADAMIAHLHDQIPQMSPDQLRNTFGAAAELEVRSWEIQGHAIAEALGRAEYGDGAYQRLGRDWGVSRSRIYQLQAAWRLRAKIPAALENWQEIVELFSGVGWYAAAAAAHRDDLEAAVARIERAFELYHQREEDRARAREEVMAARARGEEPTAVVPQRYTPRDLERSIRRERQRALQGTVEQDTEIAAAVEAHRRRRKNQPLSSMMWRDARGPGGRSTYAGNHSIYVQLDLWDYFGRPERVLDPMEGSGTTRDLCRALGIEFAGFDIKRGTNSLADPLPGQYDFIWWHPPYWAVMPYSDDEGQMARATSYDAFVAMLRQGFRKFWDENLEPGGLFAVLMGDYRDEAGRYHPLCAEVPLLDREHLEGVYVVAHPDYRSLRTNRSLADEGNHIPLAHEELCVFRKPQRARRRRAVAAAAAEVEVVDGVPDEDVAWLEDLLEPER